jgi:subtilase-type serine protease
MNMDVQIRPMSVGTLLLLVSAMPVSVQAAYLQTGTPGDAASWRSAEFQRDCGLALDSTGSSDLTQRKQTYGTV